MRPVLRRTTAAFGLTLSLPACGDEAPLALAVDEDVGPGRVEAGPTPAGDASAADARRGDAARFVGDAGETQGADAGPPVDASAPNAPPAALTTITLNLGVPGLADPVYAGHIRHQAYEDALGAALRALDADLVALQGVLPPGVCAAAVEADPTRTCFEADRRPGQAARLLGDHYVTLCDAARQTVCLGVHVRLGLAEALARETLAPPLASCSATAGACDEAQCDDSTGVSLLTLPTPLGPVGVVFFALNPPGRGVAGEFSGATCRAAQVDQLFEAAATAGEATPVLLGDLAFDPDAADAGEPAARLAARLVPQGRYRDHAPRGPDGARLATELIAGRATDTLISSASEVTCEALGAPAFDADFAAVLGAGDRSADRIHHRPVRCRFAERPGP